MSRIDEVGSLYNGGMKTKDISNKLNLKESTVERYIREYGGKTSENRIPNILILDIETSPMEVLVWGLWKQRISHENVVKDWSLLSWSAKWLHNNEIKSKHVSCKEAKERRDKSIIKDLWHLFDKADIIVAHNGKRFDIRKTNVRFLKNGLRPPMPYRIVDTYIESKRAFAFSSHSQDYLSKILDKSRKLKTEYELWKRCVGVEVNKWEQLEALNYMQLYNEQDVVTLEELYLELLPWMKTHPNLGVFPNSKGNVCSKCQSVLEKWDKYSYYTTPMGRYRVYRCKNCGSINRSRLSDLSKEERLKLISPVCK